MGNLGLLYFIIIVTKTITPDAISYIMDKTASKIFALIFLIAMGIYAFDITDALNVTGKEAEARVRAGYDRSFGFSADFSAIGDLEFHDMVNLRGGALYGKLSGVTDIKAFASAHAAPFSNKALMPIRFSLSYIYNGLLDYEAHAHSVLPVVSYNVGRVGVSYGPNFRFTSFFGEAAEFEMVNSFLVYFNFINNEKWRFGAAVGNFGDFYAKNMGAYSFKSDCEVRISGSWAIINEIELLQSGSDVLSANFYGLAWQGGARYSW
jgi:hypothetical protein